MTDTQPSDSAPAVPAPTTVAEAPSPTPGKRGILALLSLIFAGVTLLFAVIPVTAAFAWPFAVTGIVLAIIALVKKSQPRVFAIIAIIVAPVAWIIAIVVTVVVVAAGIGGALEEAGVGSDPSIEQPAEAEQEAEQEADQEPEAAVGTRDNPAALGSTIEGDEWTVIVNSVTLGATDAVLAANQFNEAPDDGYEYMLVNLTVTYTGDEANGMSPVWVGIEYVTPEGTTIDSADTFAAAPDELDRLSTLYSGATATGNIAIAIPVADGDQGVIAISPGLLENKVFFSVT